MRRNTKKRAKKPSCFGWEPSLSAAKSFAGTVSNIFGLSLLMQIPQTLADTFFNSKNPITKVDNENILVCCNGQENQIISLLKTFCDIFNVEVIGHFGKYPDYSVQNIGNTSGSAPACQLFYDKNHLEQNACFNEVFARNVTSGLTDECEIAKHAGLLMLLALASLGVVAGGALIFVTWLDKRGKKPNDESSALINNRSKNNTETINNTTNINSNDTDIELGERHPQYH